MNLIYNPPENVYTEMVMGVKKKAWALSSERLGPKSWLYHLIYHLTKDLKSVSLSFIIFRMMKMRLTSVVILKICYIKHLTQYLAYRKYPANGSSCNSIHYHYIVIKN